jgi:LPS-assembly protein
LQSQARQRLAGLALALLSLATQGLPSPALAQSSEGSPSRRLGLSGRDFDVQADSVEYDRPNDLYLARGNVQIVQEGKMLSADWVAFSNTTGEGMALGHVVVREGEDLLHAEALRFQVDGLTGVVLHGRLDSQQHAFELQGEEIESLGDDRYHMRESRFTTCQCPEGERDPWAVRSGELDVEVGGYAKARNTTIDVLDVPVFWLPWLVYPVKTERQTGLLFPVVATSSRTGFDIGIPFFWAARDALNVTLTPHYIVKRGFKPEASLEYVMGEHSFGEWFGTFVLNDDEVNPQDPGTPFDNDRWATQWRHDQFLPRGWRAKVDARVVSDNLYPYDFREFAPYRYDRHLDSLAFLENRFGESRQYGLSGELRYADDLQNPDDSDRDSLWLQRLPDVKASALPMGTLGGHVFWSLDSRYSYFTSLDRPHQVYPGAPLGPHGLFLDSGIDGIPTGHERNHDGIRQVGDATGDDFDPVTNPDGSESNGIFEEGELPADRGHRLVLNPRFYLPLRIADAVEVLPELAWHGTFYDSEKRGTEMRNLFTAQIDARTRLRRVFELPFSDRRTIHLLEPRIGYTGITRADQEDNPLFIPRSQILQARLRALEPTALTRDPSDRIDELNAVYAALGNRFYVASPGDAPPRLFADTTLSLWWDFAGDSVRNLLLDGAFFPAQRWRTRFDLGFDLDEHALDETLVEVGYGDEQGNDLTFGYRLLKDIPLFFDDFPYDDRFDQFSQNFHEIDQFDIFGRWAFLRGFAVTFRVQYSVEGSLSLRNQLGVEYVSRCKCWAIRVEVEDDRSRGYEVNVAYRVMGVGDDTVRPFNDPRANVRKTIIGY